MACLNRPAASSIIRSAPLAGLSLEAVGSSCATGRLTFFTGTLDNVRVSLCCLDTVPTIPGARAVLGEAFEVTPRGLAFLPEGKAHLALPYDAAHVVDPARVRIFALQEDPAGWIPLPVADHVFAAESQRLLYVRLSGFGSGGRYVVAEEA